MDEVSVDASHYVQVTIHTCITQYIQAAADEEVPGDIYISLLIFTRKVKCRACRAGREDIPRRHQAVAVADDK